MATGYQRSAGVWVAAAAAAVSAVAFPAAGVASTTAQTAVAVPAAVSTTVLGWSTPAITVKAGSVTRRSVRVQTGARFVTRTVWLQVRKPGGAWAAASTASTGADGRVDVLVRPPLVGRWEFRLVVPAGLYPGATTATLPVTAVPKPAEYVALGDSYSSGEGLGPWTTTPNTDYRVKGTAGFNTCHRSANDAYATKQINGKFLVRPGVTAGQRAFWACSGATTESAGKLRADLTVTDADYRNGEPNQIPSTALASPTVGPATKWITMSLGGNDAGFSDVIQSCIRAYGVVGLVPTAIRIPKKAKCYVQIGNSRNKLPGLQSRLTEHYKRLLAAAPQAKLVVVGYPRVLPDTFANGSQMRLSGTQRDAADIPRDATRICTTNKFLLPGAAWWVGVVDKHAAQLNAFEQALNATVGNAVTAAAATYPGRVTFADTWKTSMPHNCTGSTANVSVTGLMLSGTFTGTPETLGAVSTATFHPTKIGQQRIATAVEAAFNKLTTNPSAGAITRVSTAANGTQANGQSGWGPAAFSPDGTRIAFASNAENLVSGENVGGIFIKTLASGDITMVSTAADGTRARGSERDPVFSPDGTRIAFSTDWDGLVPDDTNWVDDVFVKTPASGAIAQVSTAADGTQSNGDSDAPVFSPDGTRVAFVSDAGNLLSGDTNGRRDVFVKTLASGAITRVSTAANGTQGDMDSYAPVFSPDGTRVAFVSDAGNLVPGDTNHVGDVFVKTLASGAVTRVSTAADDTEGNNGSGPLVFSPDGTRIAFASTASDLVQGDTNTRRDVFVKTLASGAITRVSTAANGTQGDMDSYAPVFSPDGTRVAFVSDAGNLVPGDTNHVGDVFVKTLASGAVTRVSTAADGTEGDLNSDFPVFSPDGRRVAFASAASDLVPGDTNGTYDVFVKTLLR